MFFIAIKNLFQERTKFAVSVGGVAFAVLLILLLNGLYQGWNTKIGAYVESIPANLWVEQEGVGDMYHTLSFLPNDLTPQLKNITGVTEVNPYLGRSILFSLKEKDQTLFVVGFDPTNGFGKPYRMKKGTWQNLTDGEIIVDEVFAKKNALDVNDTIDIGGTLLRIAGVSAGGNLIVSQYAFVTFQQAEGMFGLGDKVNFYVLRTEPGTDVGVVKQELTAQIKGIKVLTKSEFVKATRKTINEAFMPIISILVVISLLVGVAVIGLTIYSATIEKSREYGVIKAIGVSNGQLLKIVVIQSFMAGIIGYLVGLVLVFPIAWLAGSVVSGFVTEMRWFDLLWVFGATLLMSLIAAYLPVKRIFSIDPAEVFKS